MDKEVSGGEEVLPMNEKLKKCQHSEQENRDEYELLFKTDENPPWHATLAFAMQQVVLVFGSLATFPKILMGMLCADNTDSVKEYETSLISTHIFLAGLSTFLQTTFGVRLPVFQGVSASFLLSTIAVMSDSHWKCPNPLQEGIGGNYSGFNGLLNETNNTKYYMDSDGVIRNSNELWIRRMNAVQGAIIVSGVVQIIIGCSGMFGYLIRYISPIVIAPIFVMITIGMVDVTMNMCQENWYLAFLTIAVFYISFILLQRVQVPLPTFRIRGKKLKASIHSRQPIFNLFPAAFAIAAGLIGSAVWSAVSGNTAKASSISDTVASASWFYVPYPFQYGWPTFHAAAVISVLTAIVPGIIESIGDYSAYAVVCKEPHPPNHAVNRGVLMEGIGILLSGLYGTGNASTSWSGNLALIKVSRVASRRVFQYVGIIMMILALFTKSLSVFAAVPNPIIGGLLCSVIGMILSFGVSMLQHANMTNSRNIYVFGFSVVFGMAISTYANKNPDFIQLGNNELNQIFGSILRNGMFVSGTVALILDNISPGSRRCRGLVSFHSRRVAGESDRSCKTYDLPMKCNWKWMKRLPIFPPNEVDDDVKP